MVKKYRKREEGISEEAEKIVDLPLLDPVPSELIHKKILQFIIVQI